MRGDPIPASSRSSHLLGLAALLLVAGWLIPDHYPPWQSFYHEFAAFLALWTLLLHYALDPARPAFVLPRWLPGWFAVAAIPPLQAATGLVFFPGDAWMASLYILGFGLACALGYALATTGTEKLARLFAWTLLLGALLSAAISVYQWLSLDMLGHWIVPCRRLDRSCGNFGQPNHLATLLSLGLAALIYLMGRRALPALPAGLLATLLILGTVLAQSRISWFAAGAFLLWWCAKRQSVPHSGKAIGLGLALYAGMVVFWPLDTKTDLVPVTPQRSYLREPNAHLENWLEMARAVRAEPWTGYGWNQVSVAHVHNAREYPLPELLTHGHNFFLDLLVWNGVPLGLLMIGGLLFWAGTRAWRCRTPESWFALLAIGLVGVHTMFEYPLEYAYFLLPVGLLVGLVEADQPTGRMLAIPRIALWPFVAAFACLMGWIWHEYRIVEADHRLMRFETRNIGPLKADQPAPDIILLTQLREDLRMARSLARPNMSAEELEWMRRITYRYPWYSSLFRYSVSLALNGRQQEAGIEFRRLYDIYGAKPYAEAREAVQILADTRYPALKGWELPPP